MSIYSVAVILLMREMRMRFWDLDRFPEHVADKRYPDGAHLSLCCHPRCSVSLLDPPLSERSRDVVGHDDHTPMKLDRFSGETSFLCPCRGQHSQASRYRAGEVPRPHLIEDPPLVCDNQGRRLSPVSRSSRWTGEWHQRSRQDGDRASREAARRREMPRDVARRVGGEGPGPGGLVGAGFAVRGDLAGGAGAAVGAGVEDAGRPLQQRLQGAWE